MHSAVAQGPRPWGSVWLDNCRWRMALLESIDFKPMREVIEGGVVSWEPDRLATPIPSLPQIYWKGGEPWSEVNHWALVKASGTAGNNIKTVRGLMKHLAAYASWLESTERDWQHFPMRVADRTVVQFRGELIRQRDTLGILKPSTATGRMAAVIQFYRHAQAYGFVDRNSPMWRDNPVLIRFYDNAGFARTMLRASSELAIPNRAKHGETLEDGLLPVSPEHARNLLDFTESESLLELHFMLSLGFLSGARIGTIASLGVRHIEDAVLDSTMPGFCRIAVGPGTSVQTKFDVSGALLVPTFLIEALKGYSYSMHRLRRQALAAPDTRGLLFLTTRGNRYELSSITRLMTDLRRRAVAAGMRFMERFKFHQSRATYGTMLVGCALEVASAKAALAFAKEAMLHRKESTTLRYVHFVQRAPIKARISNEFAAVFSGIMNRNWNDFRA